MRCGSTTLVNILKSQQSIFIPERKELHFFDQRNPQLKSADDYAERFSEANSTQLIGEATPDYLSTPGSINRMADLLPDTKLLLILRNPVNRVLSHHRFSVLMKREIEPLETALNLETERLAHPIHEHDIFFSYKQRSRYIEHIEEILKRYRRDQLHILFLEELELDSGKVMSAVFDHLGIDPNEEWKNQVKISNQSSLMNLKQGDSNTNTPWKLKLNRKMVKLIDSKYLTWVPQSSRNRLYRQIESTFLVDDLPSDKVIALLEDYFVPYNKRLEALLGRALPW